MAVSDKYFLIKKAKEEKASDTTPRLMASNERAPHMFVCDAIIGHAMITVMKSKRCSAWPEEKATNHMFPSFDFSDDGSIFYLLGMQRTPSPPHPAGQAHTRFSAP